MLSLPKINSSYWATLMVASVFGTNTGDYVSDQMGIGHLAGLPWLAGVLALIFVAARFSGWATALFFWLVIITVRTAATNVGDAFHDFHLGFGVSLPIVLVCFAAGVAAYASFTPPRAAGDNNIRVSALYWLCMVLAGVLGTIGGDAASFALGLTPIGTGLVFGALAVAAISFGRAGLVLTPVYYWCTLALIRTAGTGAGDALAHLMGLTTSTIVTGLVFCACVVGFYLMTKVNQSPVKLPSPQAA